MQKPIVSATKDRLIRSKTRIGFSIFCLILLGTALLLCSSCEKDQITGLDLTSNFSQDFRYVLTISVYAATLRCSLGDSPDSLTINGRTFDELWPSFNTEEYVYYEIPWTYYNNFTFQDTTDYVLTKDGISYSGRIIRPGVPIMNMPVFDLQEDYSFSWTANPQPMFFRLNLYFLDDTPDECIQLAGSKRNYKVDRSYWAGASWYIFNVVMESISYKTHANDLLVYQSSGSVQNWVQPPE